tara:strand:+ start:1540 stop:2946 length:1407 start_codon:yes stop_codon:yes gene_type:complete
MLNFCFYNDRFAQKPKKQWKKNNILLAHIYLFLIVLCTVTNHKKALADNLPRQLTKSDYHEFSEARAEIGQLLFYDKILSGNRNISCGTCHHPRFGGGDGLSLGIGEGGIGVGPDRVSGTGDDRIKKRIPRNATALWNLAAKDFRVLFHDGRLSLSDDYDNNFNSPAEEWLPEGLETVLGAQAIFPMTAQFEMAGNPKENEVAGALHDRIDYVWPILAKRVRTIPEYGKMFVEVFDNIDKAEEVTIAQIGEALAAYIALDFESRDSNFDKFIAGEASALNAAEKRGMELFFGKANCSSCHSGPLLTDQKFHALAIPPFGPGRTRRFDPYARDVGRMAETDRIEDSYRFRTPSLRNVALTAPYGHNGAFPDLDGIIRHHLNPLKSLNEWKQEWAKLPSIPWLSEIDFLVWDDRFEMERFKNKIDIQPITLSDNNIADLVSFMHALTGHTAQKLRLGIPERVPSGLLIDK